MQTNHYSREGMFGGSGASYVRATGDEKVKIGEYRGVRLGHFTAEEFLWFFAGVFFFVIAALVLHGLAAAGVERLFDVGGLLGPVVASGLRRYQAGGFWVTVRGAGRVFGWFGLATVGLAFFPWSGSPTRGSAVAARVAVVFSIVASCCCCGGLATTALVVTGILSWWRNVGVDKIGVGKMCVAGLIGGLCLLSSVYSWGAVFVAVVLQCYCDGREVGGSVVDQKGIVVDNCSDVVRNCKAFAGRVVPLSLLGIPDSVFLVVARMPEEGGSVEFRRWAQMGDAVLQSVLVRRGVETGQTVAVMSQWKQSVVTRHTLGRHLLSVGDGEKVVTKRDGTVSCNVAAEMVEAIVGAAYYYSYCKGESVKWYPEALDFLFVLGLPRVYGKLI